MNKYTLIKLSVFAGLLIMIVFTTLIPIGYTQESNGNKLSGADLWAHNCSRCHNMRGPQEYKAVQWDIIVAHMRQIAGLPGAQARAISEFLQVASNPPPEPLVSKPTDQTVEIKGQELVVDVEKSDVQNGKLLYDKYCAACHGTSGKGDGPAAVSMRPSPRDLTNEEFMQTLSDEYLYEVIAYGGTKVGKSPLMPGWGNTLSQEDIIDILSYIRTLNMTK
jgi:mono/diheme cytochrome c family protein